jgi:Flp pilus assembly protein TadG
MHSYYALWSGQVKNFTKRFLNNCAGNTGTLFAVAAVPMLLAAGSAVDYMRKNDAREALVAIVDGAVLAGAQALVDNDGNKSKAEKVATDYFNAATSAEHYPWNLKINFKARADGLAMEGKGTATLDTSVMNLVGVKDMTLYPLGATDGSSAEIGGGGGTTNLEVVLMLDTTGSMCADGSGPCSTGTKISAMKTAAKDLIDKIIWEDQSIYTARIAIVPFSTRVRVGPDGGGGAAMQELTNMPQTWSGYINDCTTGTGGGNSGSESGATWVCSGAVTYPVTNWKIKPCVSDRHSYTPEDFIYTDAKPSDDDWFNAHEGSRMPVAEGSSDGAPTTGLGHSASDPMTHWNYDETGTCYDVHENNEVMGLTNNKEALKQKVDSLVAYGSTSGVLGTNFAWVMLQPSFGTMFGADVAPASYDGVAAPGSTSPPTVRKIAILMTDGAYNTFRAWKDQDRSMLADAAVSMCGNMKDKGVEVYTVGYDLDDLSAVDKTYAEDTLEACGSSVDHFYNSLNATKLQEDFQKIANSLGGESSIRLIK